MNDGARPLLEAEGLVKKYGDLTAVRGVDFSIGEGEIFGFLGPNGAGKTTTINLLTGLARITAGTVRLAGTDYTHRASWAQRVMGVVPDESNLYVDLTGHDNLCFCGALYGMGAAERRRRARELLKQFGLKAAADRPFKAYSKGMKRRLTIAAGIIHRPRILFLDEPTTGIDVASARQVRDLVRELNRAGTTIFLTTHYIEEAERLCHRVAFIVDGRIVRLGTLDELMRDVQRDTVVQFRIGETGRDVLSGLRSRFAGERVEQAGPGVFRVSSAVETNLTPFVRFFEEEGVDVYEARVIRPSLEDVFVRVTGIERERMRQEKEGGRRR